MKAAGSQRALAVGGLDPTSGAGVLLDCFVLAGCGYAPAAAVTTVTAQNSHSFVEAWPMGPHAVRLQLKALLDEGPFACVKVGAVGSDATAGELAELLAECRRGPLVVDPVLRASTGGSLAGVAREGLASLARLAEVVTPNLEEASALLGASGEDARAVVVELAEVLSTAVVVTGVPLDDKTAADLVALPDGGEVVSLRHALVPHVGDVRGTGCIFSSALAAALADGKSVAEAVRSAQAVVGTALTFARPLGRGRWQTDLGAMMSHTDLAGHRL